MVTLKLSDKNRMRGVFSFTGITAIVVNHQGIVVNNLGIVVTCRIDHQT